MLRTEANRFQYVFMGGILGEILELPVVGNYLRENEKILRELGVQDIHTMTLSSFNSAHRNAGKLMEVLRSKYATSEKKFIIFSHSKACLEVLLALGKEFDFFRSAVERIICVQPPFKGSEVLEAPILKPLLKAWPGLASLTKDCYTEFFQRELVAVPERSAFLRDRVTVIRTFKARSRDVAWAIRPFHYVMKRAGARSDGLLTLDEQTISRAPYRELVLEMDHSDLFTSSRLSTEDSAFRRSLMVTLINSSLLSSEDVIPARLHDPEVRFVF